MPRRVSLLCCLTGVVVLASMISAAPLPVKSLPAEIKTSIAKRFPKAKIVSAHTEGIDHIEVKLKNPKGVVFEVVYKARYKAVVTEFAVNSLPIAVTNALEKRYPGASVTRAEALKNARETTILYELHIQWKGKARTVYLNPKGSFTHEP